MEDIEYNLTQHPLALFPHLEESLAAEVSKQNSFKISDKRIEILQYINKNIIFIQWN